MAGVELMNVPLVRNPLYLSLMLDQISRARDLNCIKQTQALDIVNQWEADGCPKTQDYSVKGLGVRVEDWVGYG